MPSVEALQTLHALVYRRVALYVNEEGEPRLKLPSGTMLTDREKADLKHYKGGITVLIGEFSPERGAHMFARAVAAVAKSEPGRWETATAFLNEAQDWYSADPVERPYLWAEVRYWLWRALLWADPTLDSAEELWWWAA